MARRRGSLASLSAREAAVFTALARALFPRDRRIDVDWDDAGVIARLDDYAHRLPPAQRLNLTALVTGTEAAWVAWIRRPGARLADARPEKVLEFIDWWSRHARYELRQAWLAVKSLLSFAYVESPEVMREIGLVEEGA